jgi:hypothetical protein
MVPTTDGEKKIVPAAPLNAFTAATASRRLQEGFVVLPAVQLVAVPVAGSDATVTVKLEGALQTALSETELTPLFFTVTLAVPLEVMGVARYVPGALKLAIVVPLPCVAVTLDDPLISVKVMTSPLAKVLIVVDAPPISVVPPAGKSVGTAVQPVDFAMAAGAVSASAASNSMARVTRRVTGMVKRRSKGMGKASPGDCFPGNRFVCASSGDFAAWTCIRRTI